MSALEKRIAAVLEGNDATSADIAILIAETEAAINQADETAEAERMRALDPLASPNPDAARKTMEDAAFAADRLRNILPRLRTRYREIADKEYVAAWLADYEGLKPVRDQLAQELLETYPIFAAKLIDLLGRIKAHDEELSKLHQARPAGVKLHLLGAELMARGLDGFSRDDPPITRELQLPDWTCSCRLAYPAPFNPAVFIPQVVHDSRRYSGDWHEVIAEEQRVLRDKHEREAAEEEAKRRENWHGPQWDRERV